MEIALTSAAGFTSAFAASGFVSAGFTSDLVAIGLASTGFFSSFATYFSFLSFLGDDDLSSALVSVFFSSSFFGLAAAEILFLATSPSGSGQVSTHLGPGCFEPCMAPFLILSSPHKSGSPYV